MTPGTEITFFRNHLIIGCDAGPGDRLIVRIAGQTFSSPPVSDGHRAIVSIDYAPLYDADALPHELELASPAATVRLPQLDALSLVDIRSKAEFDNRVQGPASRQLHDEAARFCCRRAIRRHSDNYPLQAAAACVLGYRILEALDPDDTDIAEVRNAGLAIIRETPAGEDGIRWRSSVGTMLGYLGILLQDPDLSQEALSAALEHRDAGRLRTPNYARGEILLAALSLMQERKGEALELLRDIEDAFRGGVAGSRIEIPSQGYYACTEIHASLFAVRAAFDLRRAIAAIPNGVSPETVTLNFNFSGLSPILRALTDEGHFRAWLKAASATKLRRVRPPSEVHGFRKRSGALLANVWSAVENNAPSVNSDWPVELDALTKWSVALASAGNFSWSGLLDLAESRYWLGLKMAHERSPEASRVLAGAAPWAKRVFSTVPFAERADFARMEAIMSLVMSSYLVEHSLLNPLPAYADRAEFTRLATHHGRSAFKGEEGKAKLVTSLVKACGDADRDRRIS
ncbi:hypothetical protein [Paracoccus litorisediminis]|uniref:Uncharacterized protein n=1 Tax=Paracoccus litorisediminis TaxID=2006130 RepID=A0A844HNR2_9RHOB|nr:hypothetical protein [Paracoccus litorisediminis]MTH60688.1 hypothetical protein [Paracoccus litorisediminis]